QFVMPELSVTATENALIAMAFAKGYSNLRLAASEPHVQNLCEFLQSAGAQISGIGSHALEIKGIKNNENISPEITVTSDYLQVGTYVLAGILTNSEITVHNAEISHLDSFIERLKQTGAKFEVNEKEKYIKTLKRDVINIHEKLTAVNIQTGVFPKFATDLHPQFAVLLTQCEGVSKIQETLFERKFAYLLELEKMGADVEIQNPHVFKVTGPTPFIGTTVASQDIRAGAAMILAALITDGITEITNIHYIHRGYEDIEGNLTKLGAEIKTVV
ncbi:TPA: UDP-N-acetylglucosamine 1-carboxyvinyltransferase, partial [Candidatus Gracilibacteria bacterium]|nr:UDP-N-acetylglucosamine 1-carboxyvinyltransferase [Candidatus Gracilibacteria bacterium]